MRPNAEAVRVLMAASLVIEGAAPQAFIFQQADIRPRELANGGGDVDRGEFRVRARARCRSLASLAAVT